MEKTPLSMRKHVVLVGQTNSGKSTLFNQLLGQELAIVSDVRGTTTDAVTKAMELIPFGPIALVDTAGFGDETELGKARMGKTEQVLHRADLILYIVDVTQANQATAIYFSKPFLVVYTKCESLTTEELQTRKKETPDAVFLSKHATDGLDELKKRMIEKLEGKQPTEKVEEEETWIGDLLLPNSTVILVTPIDSAAPKGRLILPQVQILRDCLDHDIKAMVTKENTLKEALKTIPNPDLVITDSQIFSMVDATVPKEIPLTSFSMLLARKKGNWKQYLDGAKALENLKDGDAVLVMEGCAHNPTHEDIARHKLPMLIQKKLGVNCRFFFYTGYDFPEDLSPYTMAISCGMCMVNQEEINHRCNTLYDAGIPVTNFGIAIAELNGILSRATQIFPQ